MSPIDNNTIPEPISCNIHYKTDELARYYSTNRIRWNDFYPSERCIMEMVSNSERGIGRVLDVGCATGGLGIALAERFSVSNYLGVDICTSAIKLAKARTERYPVSYRFESGDILTMKNLQVEGFDTVFSLSCADWNVETHAIINTCWKYIRKGGYFVITLRLTPEISLCNMSESYQYI